MVAVTRTVEHAHAPHPHHHRGWWWKTLLAGLAGWVIVTVVTLVTKNTNLVPTLILVGSFLVPFCVVLFVVERVTGSVSTLQLILAFFVGGISGVLAASLLEATLERTPLTFALVGLIEELVKGVILIVVGWRVVPKTAVQGALLGATVGAGFAAFESAGYAFTAAITARGIDVASLLQTEALRAIFAPLGHVVWTAIFGAVLFGAARMRDRFRWSFLIVVAYLVAALLHALWDSMIEIGTVLALLLTGNTPQSLSSGDILASTLVAIESLAIGIYVVGLIVVAALGIVVLWGVLRHYRQREARAARAVEAA